MTIAVSIPLIVLAYFINDAGVFFSRLLNRIDDRDIVQFRSERVDQSDTDMGSDGRRTGVLRNRFRSQHKLESKV